LRERVAARLLAPAAATCSLLFNAGSLWTEAAAVDRSMRCMTARALLANEDIGALQVKLMSAACKID
jgi:hypothetical protein